MSTDATRWVWKLTKDQVTPTEKLILLAIADRCGEEGECWPSISRLVRDTGFSRDAIIQNRKTLIDKEILTYTGEYKGRAKQIPVMKLMCDEWRKGDPKDDEPDQSSKTTGRPERPVVDIPPVVQNDGYQSFKTTQNLKEESKKKDLKHKGNSPELLNPVYTSPDNPKEKPLSRDYSNKQTQEHIDTPSTHRVEGEGEKSDYFDNKINNETVSKTSYQKQLNMLLENNIFNLPEDMICDWIENRKAKRQWITKTAWRQLNEELAACKSKGIDPILAFKKSVAAGNWTSIKPEYFSATEPTPEKSATEKPKPSKNETEEETKERHFFVNEIWRERNGIGYVSKALQEHPEKREKYARYA